MSLRKRISLRNTLSFRLTLWYAGIFAVSSCVAFLLFYALITSFIREQTDQDLLVQVSRFSTLLASEDIEAVKNAAVIEAQAAGVKKVFFRLLSLNGQVFSSSNMAYWKNIDIHEATLKELLRGRRPVFETITISQRREKVRILYAMLGPAVVLQVGQAMESYSRFLDAFKGIFITTMTLLIIVAAGAGWFMARPSSRAWAGPSQATHSSASQRGSASARARWPAGSAPGSGRARGPARERARSTALTKPAALPWSAVLASATAWETAAWGAVPRWRSS